jgi:hypothetical protein
MIGTSRPARSRSFRVTSVSWCTSAVAAMKASRIGGVAPRARPRAAIAAQAAAIARSMSNDPGLEPRREIIVEPRADPPALLPMRQQLNTEPDLGKGQNAEVQRVFVGGFEPRDDGGIRPRSGPFGDDVGIEQISHSSTSRGGSRGRSVSSLEPLSGDLFRNSTKLSLRAARRAHSLAETTTTARLPGA